MCCDIYLWIYNTIFAQFLTFGLKTVCNYGVHNFLPSSVEKIVEAEERKNARVRRKQLKRKK